jgi:hypothetical protein
MNEPQLGQKIQHLYTLRINIAFASQLIGDVDWFMLHGDHIQQAHLHQHAPIFRGVAGLAANPHPLLFGHKVHRGGNVQLRVGSKFACHAVGRYVRFSSRIPILRRMAARAVSGRTFAQVIGLSLRVGCSGRHSARAILPGGAHAQGARRHSMHARRHHRIRCAAPGSHRRS